MTSPCPMRWPRRALDSKYGALLMLSMPPATTRLALPARIRSVANMVAFMPDPHTLFTVVAPTPSGISARRMAWRAGAWPTPALMTQPMRTSSMAAGSVPAARTAAPMACAPSSGADLSARLPRKLPMGVRWAATMNASFTMSPR